jgi:hypothetical protein
MPSSEVATSLVIMTFSITTLSSTIKIAAKQHSAFCVVMLCRVFIVMLRVFVQRIIMHGCSVYCYAEGICAEYHYA